MEYALTSALRYPVLYTFRRCPYAMRARMALAYAQIDFEIREVVLRDKPAAMLALSDKGTVPVLQLGQEVLDESLDIMHWALGKHDPEGWLEQGAVVTSERDALIQLCDEDFKLWLDRYKYNSHQTQYSESQARQEAERFLSTLESLLAQNGSKEFLFDKMSIADVAIFPFIRQFAFVDKQWFDESPYPLLQQWLAGWLGSERFGSIMQKYPQWHPGDPQVLFVQSGQ